MARLPEQILCKKVSAGRDGHAVDTLRDCPAKEFTQISVEVPGLILRPVLCDGFQQAGDLKI